MLVAESFARRFFNVIQLLSQSVPLIAIQVSVVEADGHRVLHFSKLLDVYEEPDDSTAPPEPVDEAYWRQNSPSTLEIAKDFLEIIKSVLPDATLKFVRAYVAIRVGKSGYNYFSLMKRASDRPVLWFRVSSDTIEAATSALEEAGLSYVKGSDHLQLGMTKEMVSAHAETFRKIAALVKRLWES